MSKRAMRSVGRERARESRDADKVMNSLESVLSLPPPPRTPPRAPPQNSARTSKLSSRDPRVRSRPSTSSGAPKRKRTTRKVMWYERPQINKTYNGRNSKWYKHLNECVNDAKQTYRMGGPDALYVTRHETYGMKVKECSKSYRKKPLSREDSRDLVYVDIDANSIARKLYPQLRQSSQATLRAERRRQLSAKNHSKQMESLRYNMRKGREEKMAEIRAKRRAKRKTRMMTGAMMA